METIKLKISELANDPANARKHDQRNIKAIADSLQRFGQQKPIVIDKSKVVRAGNGTLEAAKMLGWDEIACVMTSLTGAEATAYAIADNRTAELAEWDDPVLMATLQSLEDEDRELLEACGYTEAELDDLVQQKTQQSEPSDQVDLIEKFEIVVTCDSEDDQKQAYELITEKGYKCRVLTF